MPPIDELDPVEDLDAYEVRIDGETDLKLAVHALMEELYDLKYAVLYAENKLVAQNNNINVL